MAPPKKVADRIVAGLKQLIPIVKQQQSRDVSEADTVTLVKDLLADAFGYNKYTDLTSELAIRGTFCDLGVRIDDKVCELVEVKAVGVSLNERHLKQAVDYAANQGIEWVILTNAIHWQLHHVVFTKPIQNRLIATVDLTAIDTRKEAELDVLFAFTKEGLAKGVPAAIRDRQDATSRYLLAALIVKNETVLGFIRRELRRVVGVNVTEQEVARVLESEVIKRDALEGVEATQAAMRVKKAEKRTLRTESRSESAATETESAISTEPSDQ